MKEIKFKAYRKEENKIVDVVFINLNNKTMHIDIESKDGMNRSCVTYEDDAHTLLSYTGKKDIEGNELYEGDTCLSTDGEATRVIVAWVEEWYMFASLLEDEYTNYQKEGASALDEPMFWTYTLEMSQDDLRKVGNINLE